MAKTEFIFQGFTAKTHRAAIERLFDVPDIERVIVSVAFVNERGVDLLHQRLAAHCAKTTAFIGIRNEITSVQGATRLLHLGVSLFVVDTAWRAVVFHPKLYLARGKNQARLVVGSANLTAGGLNNNIEASVAVDLALNDADDNAVAQSIEKEFDALAHDYPKHVFAITSVSELDDLLANGRLDERAARPLPLTMLATTPTGDLLPRIKLKVKPLLTSPLQVVHAGAKPAPTAKPAVAAPPPTAALGIAYELVWQSKALTRSDLSLAAGKTTNIKASVSLDKGLLPADVDQRHYFRETVFSTLAWGPSTSKTVEEAHANCHLIVKGVSQGVFNLRVAHTMGITSATYMQGNAMTRLGWGPARALVSRPDLVGRTLALYRDKADPKRFVIEID
jgi:HKD family nuclease